MKLSHLMLALMLLGNSEIFAQFLKSRVNNFNLESGMAVDGYDPVAYFTENGAVKGKKEFRSTYQGVIYQFASEKQKEIFDANPKKYEPQYGGWCAYAMGKGKGGDKVSIDPKTFEVKDGKLYLFYNKFFYNTLKLWKKNTDKLKSKADDNWQEIIK